MKYSVRTIREGLYYVMHAKSEEPIAKFSRLSDATSYCNQCNAGFTTFPDGLK